ncbi:carboxypeptidase regulatory-like domain-containing protein [Acinetobacter bereziniae]|uniref:carboxypeptidase regulatory-like domain-containing protein n=1 Tax=Acinetobacter bereziniae TaxID=106648 RepID=UPI00300B1D8E
MFVKAYVKSNIHKSEIIQNSVYKIKGVLLKKGIPIIGLVHLFSLSSKRIVKTTRSHDDGSYEFKGLAKTEFILFSRDEARNYNAVIQDNVVPK